MLRRNSQADFRVAPATVKRACLLTRTLINEELACFIWLPSKHVTHSIDRIGLKLLMLKTKLHTLNNFHPSLRANDAEVLGEVYLGLAVWE